MAEIRIKTREQIEEEKLLESLIPTQEEIENAILEIKILTLLEEVLV